MAEDSEQRRLTKIIVKAIRKDDIATADAMLNSHPYLADVEAVWRTALIFHNEYLSRKIMRMRGGESVGPADIEDAIARHDISALKRTGGSPGGNQQIPPFHRIVMSATDRDARRNMIDAALESGWSVDEKTAGGLTAMVFAVAYMRDDVEYFEKMSNSSQTPKETLKHIEDEVKRTQEELGRDIGQNRRSLLSVDLGALERMGEITRLRCDSNPGLYGPAKDEVDSLWHKLNVLRGSPAEADERKPAGNTPAKEKSKT